MVIRKAGQEPQKANENQGAQAASAAKSQKTSKTSSDLMDGKKVTGKYMERQGFDILGAGKPPVYSDRAPQKPSKRVSQAIAGTPLLPAAKKQRSH